MNLSMNRRLAIKEWERRNVEIFKSIFNEFPEGELVSDASQERPDIVVKGPNGKTGIEITRILHQDLRREESECEALVSAARNLYEKRNLPHLQVSIHFGSEKPFSRSNRPVFASTIADLVAANVPEARNGLVEIQNDWDNPQTYPYEVGSILILRNPVLTGNYWSAGQAGWISEDFVPELQKVIGTKEACLRGYDATCDALWLLIVADNGGPSGFFDPSPTTLAHEYTSSFDRVFFLRPFSRKVCQLKIRKKRLEY
jgi:hypothetical protein